jgi:hypothetical protein
MGTGSELCFASIQRQRVRATHMGGERNRGHGDWLRTAVRRGHGGQR